MFCASVSKLGLVVTSVLAMACLASSLQPLPFSSSCCSLPSLALLTFGTEAMLINKACQRQHHTHADSRQFSWGWFPLSSNPRQTPLLAALEEGSTSSRPKAVAKRQGGDSEPLKYTKKSREKKQTTNDVTNPISHKRAKGLKSPVGPVRSGMGLRLVGHTAFLQKQVLPHFQPNPT